MKHIMAVVGTAWWLRGFVFSFPLKSVCILNSLCTTSNYHKIGLYIMCYYLFHPFWATTSALRSRRQSFSSLHLISSFLSEVRLPRGVFCALLWSPLNNKHKRKYYILLEQLAAGTPLLFLQKPTKLDLFACIFRNENISKHFYFLVLLNILCNTLSYIKLFSHHISTCVWSKPSTTWS